jgi:hypothetical protein
MGMEIKLSRAEVFKAIFEYVERYYPVRGENATINVQNNKILGAVVDCKWEQKQNELPQFGIRTVK